MSYVDSPRGRSPDLTGGGKDGTHHGISTQPISGLEASATAPAPGTVEAPANTFEEVTGVKLLMIMTGVILACFLMLLDTSILVTVTIIMRSEFKR